MSKIPNDAMLLYHRQGERLRFKIESMTTLELRELMIGIWARLPHEHRADHIRELQSYNTDKDSWLSDVAGSIARGVAGENAIDLRDVLRFRHEDLP